MQVRRMDSVRMKVCQARELVECDDDGGEIREVEIEEEEECLRLMWLIFLVICTMVWIKEMSKSVSWEGEEVSSSSSEMRNRKYIVMAWRAATVSQSLYRRNSRANFSSACLTVLHRKALFPRFLTLNICAMLAQIANGSEGARCISFFACFRDRTVLIEQH